MLFDQLISRATHFVCSAVAGAVAVVVHAAGARWGMLLMTVLIIALLWPCCRCPSCHGLRSFLIPSDRKLSKKRRPTESQAKVQNCVPN